MRDLFIQSIITMLLPAIFVFVFLVAGGPSGGDTLDHILAFVLVLLTMAAMHYVLSDREP